MSWAFRFKGRLFVSASRDAVIQPIIHHSRHLPWTTGEQLGHWQLSRFSPLNIPKLALNPYRQEEHDGINTFLV